MQIISKETLRYFIVQGATIVLATIFSCYGIAVSLGHVPVWLPMISDCGVYAPEKYLFRLGLVTGSIFLHAESFLLYNADKAFSNSRLCMVLSLLSSMGMALVGVVNEKENDTVHTAAAIVTYAGYSLYMIVMTFYSIQEPTIGPTSMTIKKVCTVLGVGALTAFQGLVEPDCSGSRDYHYCTCVHFKGYEDFTGESRTYVALCEWVGTICIMVYNISFGADVDGLYLCEVNYNNTNNNNNNEKKIIV